MDQEGLLNFGGENTFFVRFFYGVVASLTVLIAAFDKMDRERDIFFQRRDNAGDTFDFIIVGGGTTGSVLANRLSQDYRVLLLEAGGDPYPWQAIPALTPFMANHREIDWMYQSTPQKRACFAMVNKTASLCQGKALGGSSNLSYMNYLRGSPFDYEHWANVTGDTGWKYDNLLPYFKRHEDYRGPWLNSDTHGFEGDMRMETPNYTGMADSFIRAGVELGYKQTDLNGLFMQGFDTVISPLRRGYRQATFAAFVQRIRPRAKLTIRKYATVNRLLLAGKEKGVYGVEYERHGKNRSSFATREVILSAGAINTPKLLMLAGIGPRKHLQAMNIPVVADLPVGQNLQDHLATFLGPFMIKPNSSFLIDRDLNGANVAKFGMSNGQGPLTSTGVHANALLSSSQAKASGQGYWPDYQLTLFGVGQHGNYDKDIASVFHLDKNVSSKYFGPVKGRDAFTIVVTLARPSSRGEVLLKSKNATMYPIINPKYLDTKGDVDIMLDGVHRALDLVERTRVFRDINATFTTTKFPGCENYEFRSGAYWRCYIRHFTLSMNHLAGTCSMGKVGSASTVVDSQMRVLGVKRLRVMDASIMPTVPVGGTEAAAIMIGEKGAEMIKTFWEKKSRTSSSTTTFRSTTSRG